MSWSSGSNSAGPTQTELLVVSQMALPSTGRWTLAALLIGGKAESMVPVYAKPPASTLVPTAPARVIVDGNEAAAYIAHRLSEVIAIYPITPSSAMGELADSWSAAGQRNLWGSVPEVVEMQSEGGAAGAIHGALQVGAMATTFTASQGLLLMIPNMFKIAGELTAFVMHVAARAVATHALSIFGDHSDVMAARPTGFAMLCSSSVQEAQDLALVAHAATLEARVPFLHFFDGFRTSHELNKIARVSDGDIRVMIRQDLVEAHRARGLDPDRPVLRGSAQNPDVYFQAREAVNRHYMAVPGIVSRAMTQFARLTGRGYGLFDYVGTADADRVIVMMGSGCGAAEEAVDRLNQSGERVGLVKVRLYRPFDVAAFVAALPITATRVAVLDRTKEPGAVGEPLYQDVVTALAESAGAPRMVLGGRYGLASKEFTPAMAAGVFTELRSSTPRRHFTVGIRDDVTNLSLEYDASFSTESPDVVRAVFYGLGSDGTVGANHNSIKIIGEHTDHHAQGYFVYDSKKSGSVTVSHLRFGPRPIRSTYLIESAGFVACHQFGLLQQVDVLGLAARGATFLLNSPYDPSEVWGHLPLGVQRTILERGLRFHVVNAARVAHDAGLPLTRVNTVLQTCFFALSGVLPQGQAIEAIKQAIRRSYLSQGDGVVQRNWRAVDLAIAGLHEVIPPCDEIGGADGRREIPTAAPDFVKRVTAIIMEGQGDRLPVSAMPVDGTFPTGTARWEKRGIAAEIPVWDPSICIDCAKCVLICPHAAIRMKVYPADTAAGAPDGFQHKEWRSREQPGMLMTIQVAPDDCTGCSSCVDYCPAISRSNPEHRAVDMAPRVPLLERERDNWNFFLGIAEFDRTQVNVASIKGSQLLQPLFEFSGACAGCGETPYLKLLSQMYGDRILVANATGCSSIYGGNLPTTPWSCDVAGRGPAWANSLFEDNAEFGMGMRVALDVRLEMVRSLLEGLASQVGEDLAKDLHAGELDQSEAGIAAQRERIALLRARLAEIAGDESTRLSAGADAFVHRAVWIVGGDGWAYDIGFGGLDHVLASGRDVNVLVLDTEVYSNTGGQASKATPRGAVAKYAAAGKRTRKKDLGMIATLYGNVYVAEVALGADNQQTITAFAEAAAHRGPSLILAYGTCIAHGIDMSTGQSHQREAVATGYWPLYRYDPSRSDAGQHPLQLDSGKAKMPIRQFTDQETRFSSLSQSRPADAAVLAELEQADVDERRRLYEQLAGLERRSPDPGS